MHNNGFIFKTTLGELLQMLGLQGAFGSNNQLNNIPVNIIRIGGRGGAGGTPDLGALLGRLGGGGGGGGRTLDLGALLGRLGGGGGSGGGRNPDLGAILGRLGGGGGGRAPDLGALFGRLGGGGGGGCRNGKCGNKLF